MVGCELGGGQEFSCGGGGRRGAIDVIRVVVV